MNVADTIIAIGSPPGRSQRTLLRIAGPALVVTSSIRFAASAHVVSSSDPMNFRHSVSSHRGPAATPVTTSSSCWFPVVDRSSI